MVDVRARAAEGARKFNEVDATIQTADFGVFIDFMSMFQPDDTTGAKPAYKKPAEQASFGRALRNIGLPMGTPALVVFKMTETPLPAAATPIACTVGVAWFHLERRLGDLEAPATNSLDVSMADGRGRARRHGMKKRYGGGLSAGGARPPQLRESEEELAAQGDHAATIEWHAGRADPRRARRASEP